ncbi:hypothetical protein T4A_2403 [Trichinella pseudospiralis]|uniref:Uncharacterized protein n=1 Tax=Trichinella pseudospiralis TaxID=6337 RepID=A0A0V1EAW4_TRIPS|nr:hypothetical protein T4A_2403 [Trichinella pseudospiralis]KRZ44660.1 hypothetical protein T4C_5145 [Trichinella pseudospiralis]
MNMLSIKLQNIHMEFQFSKTTLHFSVCYKNKLLTNVNNANFQMNNKLVNVGWGAKKKVKQQQQ